MIQIRQTVYRDRRGFMLVGKDRQGRRVSVFADTRDAAEHIRRKIERGEAITTFDFQFAGIPRQLSCGCCTGGCTCWNHRDEPNGRPVAVCLYHRPEGAAK